MTTHRRIRPFNTRETYPEQHLDNDLCQAVVAGNTVYLRGQIGQDLETRESVGVGDVTAQTERAMANIAMLLEESGSAIEDIVKIVVYLTDIRYRDPVYQVMGRWLKGVFPVSTGLVVTALARPEWVVEIDATAVMPGSEVGSRKNELSSRSVGQSFRTSDLRLREFAMTLSIAGRCARSGQFGIAIASSSPAVAARCAWARAGVGAVCTQNITDPRLGPLLLDRMAADESAVEAMRAMTAAEPSIAWRQLTAIDREGMTATWSGEQTLGTYATAEGPDCVAAGNLLADSHVPLEMAGAFAGRPDDDLGTRLTAALAAGLEAGGEAGPVHSAGLLIVSDVPWPLTDLRVDWAEDPVAELTALWRLWRPQAETYRTRALDPAAAPSYGVPGDEGDGVMG